MGFNDKWTAVIDEYIVNGFVQNLAYASVYKGCTAIDQSATQLFSNTKFKANLAKRMAKIETELDLSREKQHKKLEKALALAVATKSPSAMVSAIREQNEMLGYHRDKAPNTERETAKLKLMDTERRRIAQELAQLLTRKQVVSVPVSGPETGASGRTVIEGDNAPSETKHA